MMSGHIFLDINRPFASCPKPLFHNEAKCEAIDMKIIFYSHASKTYFHKKSFALSVIFKGKVLELKNGLLQTLYVILCKGYICVKNKKNIIH